MKSHSLIWSVALITGLLVTACSGSGSGGASSSMVKVGVLVFGTSCGGTANELPTS